MRSLESSERVVPKLDVSIGGVFLPRGKAIPLIVQIESDREMRQSGLFAELPRPDEEPARRNVA